METLQHIIDTSGNPLLIAAVLGLMTALSPCPLATNITAIGFLSKDIESRKHIFFNGLFYTLGRSIGYFVIALILYAGASSFRVSLFFQHYGELLLGPFLIITGVIMLDVIPLRFAILSKLTDRISSRQKRRGSISSLVIGLLFSLAFCPYSAMLFFGMLMPLTITSPQGLSLPLLFALTTALPVVITAYILAFSINSIGGFFNKMKTTGIWMKRIVAILFIMAGIYFFYAQI